MPGLNRHQVSLRSLLTVPKAQNEGFLGGQGCRRSSGLYGGASAFQAGLVEREAADRRGGRRRCRSRRAGAI